MRKRKIKKAANKILNSNPNKGIFSFYKLDNSAKWVKNCYHKCKMHQYYVFKKDKYDIYSGIIEGEKNSFYENQN